MPSDANGVFSLPSGYLAETGETIQASQHNPPLEDLASAMSARLMRSGAAPMTGPLKIVDGSVGSPAVQLANGSSTGFYKTTNGIGVSIGGTKVAEFGSGGLIAGARWIGELVPFTGLTAPPLTVLPYGQTLSRTSYPDLWTFAQDEIAAGNTFYNNGNGSTTFGIGDMRGRVPAGKDNMGGSSASRLSGTSMTPGSTTLGATGGAETKTLATANLPPYTPSGSITNGAITISGDAIKLVGGSVISNSSPGGSFSNTGASITASQATSTFTGSAQGGTSTPLAIVQPTIITNYVLYAGA